jgi:Uma2 family endonuclease
MQGAQRVQITYQEYLNQERSSPTKHEYVAGELFAMAGGTPEHAALAAAFTVALGRLLENKPCRVFSSDLRVRVEEIDFSTYPDLTVVCGKLETSATDPDAVTNPTLILEVLSPSTEAYDRGQKAAYYRRIRSLNEYVIVSQAEKHVEVYRRNEQGRWELGEYVEGQEVELTSLGVRIPIDRIYVNPLGPSQS